MTLVKNNAIPVHTQEGTPRRALAIGEHRVGRHRDVGIRVDVALEPVERMDLETGRELLNFGAPLTHNRLGHNNERAWLWVGEHGGNELHSLAQTHFVAQEPA